MSEFTRVIDVRQAEGKHAVLEASEAERAALAERFGIVAVNAFTADVVLHRKGRDVLAEGTLAADIVQSCAVSGEDLPVALREDVAFRFVPDDQLGHLNEEVELEADELDDIPYSGTQIDLGEALAQTLALAIDPFLTGPNADEARKRAGIVEEGASGPFAALAALKKD